MFDFLDIWTPKACLALGIGLMLSFSFFWILTVLVFSWMSRII